MQIYTYLEKCSVNDYMTVISRILEIANFTHKIGNFKFIDLAMVLLKYLHV